MSARVEFEEGEEAEFLRQEQMAIAGRGEAEVTVVAYLEEGRSAVSERLTKLAAAIAG